MKILLVEDEVSVAKVIEQAVETMGHNIDTAYTGKDAMKKLKKQRFDLMLLDIYLPDCRGDKLIPKFKKIRPDMGIVAMTGYNTMELELEVRQQGIIYYMIKPFKIEEMKEILDHVSKKKVTTKVQSSGVHGSRFKVRKR